MSTVDDISFERIELFIINDIHSWGMEVWSYITLNALALSLIRNCDGEILNS